MDFRYLLSWALDLVLRVAGYASKYKVSIRTFSSQDTEYCAPLLHVSTGHAWLVLTLAAA